MSSALFPAMPSSMACPHIACGYEAVSPGAASLAGGAVPGGAWFDFAKRGLDIAGAVVGLAVLAPLLAAVALAVRLSSGGPVLFTQTRIGLHGAPFRIYKFRTMGCDAPAYARSPQSRGDPRITKLGRFLRHTCLDELPQLFNVAKGEMSLVGPRPEMPFLVAQYRPTHWQRLTVKPGMTGLWQLNGDRRVPMHHDLSHDLYYIAHRNLSLDLSILFRTCVFACRGLLSNV